MTLANGHHATPLLPQPPLARGHTCGQDGGAAHRLTFDGFVMRVVAAKHQTWIVKRPTTKSFSTNMASRQLSLSISYRER